MLSESQKIEYLEAAKMEYANTEQSILELEEVTQPIAPENSIGRISRMDAINNKSMNDEALRKVKQRLKRLERQIDRINENNFGLCIKCGKEIPFGRITYMPDTTVCVQCVP